MDYVKKSKELRKNILKMIHNAKSGHPGGSLSVLEILMALYYDTMVYDINEPKKDNRDLLVLSKGHACPALYAILADVGFFSNDELSSLRKIDSNLQGHPDSKKTIGVDVNTGSLGQGASVSIGLALGAKLKNKLNSNFISDNESTFNNKKVFRNCQRIFTILGDGELQEGIVWEAAMSAAHYKLDNLTFIVDNNGLQIDGKNDDVMSLLNIIDKFKAFGFETFEVDGHNIDELIKVLNIKVENKPKFILAHTIKGKGISFMENCLDWHGKAPNDEQLDKALAELED